MKHGKKYIALISLLAAFTLSGWVLPACSSKKDEDYLPPQTDIVGDGNGQDEEQLPENNGQGNNQGNNNQQGSNQENNSGQQNGGQEGNEPSHEVSKPNSGEVAPPPKQETVEYIRVNSSGVNLRTGAGTGYSSAGAAEKGTLYALLGRSGNWYKTYYRGKTVYISANYCSVVQMDKSANADVENVIAEGCKYMGVPYVYGATRYHNGAGGKLSGFTTNAFDCSSLMQYIFKIGAGVNLQMNTRTQIGQGTTVKKSELKRGDLLFFTNASRQYNTGIERVGHVALYLGDNYILHTASDYAKIEQISATRWGYYIQTQRML